MDGDRLKQFVEACFEDASTDRLALYVVSSADHTRQQCREWAIRSDEAATPDAAEVYEQIEARALSQVNAMGGTHVFLLEAIHGESPGGRVLAHEVFRVSAEALPGGAVLSEPANEGGLLAQLMRHNEAIMRTAVQGSDRLLAQQGKIVDRLATRAEKAEDRQIAQMELVLDARYANDEQQIRLLKAQSNAEVKKALGNKVATLLPELAARFKEHRGDDPTSTALTRARGLVQSLRPEQVQHLMAGLDPEQQAALLAFIRPFVEEHDSSGSGERGGVH